MRNISFDNPLLLLIAIPLLAAVIVPFAIAIRKDNVSKSVIASLVLHVLMVACITLASAGLIYTTVMTQTHVYVVADVSYSSHRDLDSINEYIHSIKNSLPRNSKMGVICFARDQDVLTPMGGSIVDVAHAKVDESATNIADALNYTSGKFEDNVIKRIVLITDGSETDSASSAGLIAAIENLHLKDIYLDVIYLDTNISEDVDEVQISEVEFTGYTYKAHETTADVLLQSNRDATAILTLYKDDEKIAEQAKSLTKGYNVINFDLDTSAAGTFNYRLELESEGDVTEQNNIYTFTQQVEDKLEVLLLTESEADLAQAKALYGERANIDAPLVPDAEGNTGRVPFSIEELCVYDEIVLSNFDVRTLEDRTAFMESLDQAVSRFGKSLITIGDTNIQNKTEEDLALSNLENMLPVKFGNSAGDPKAYAIVFDISHSLSFVQKSQLARAKKAAKAIINLLDDQDYVMILPFWGSNGDESSLDIVNRSELEKEIDSYQPKQGTMLGAAMKKAYQELLENEATFSEMEMFVISDGLTAITDTVDHPQLAADMKEDGIITSSIYVQRGSRPEDGDGEEGTNNIAAIKRLEDIAKQGGGNYYRITDDNVDDIMLNEVAESMTESIVNCVSEVDIKNGNDAVLAGLNSLPQISGYVNSKAKASATVVLTTKYVRASGSTKAVPVYAYWSYGNGRVSTFTSSFTGEWVSAWTEDERASTFFQNVLKTNTPDEKNGTPYSLAITSNGTETDIEITPVVLNPYATMEVEITDPDENTTTQKLVFDSQKYSYIFDTPVLGRYCVKIA